MQPNNIALAAGGRLFDVTMRDRDRRAAPDFLHGEHFADYNWDTPVAWV